jgi:hypothetical protein
VLDALGQLLALRPKLSEEQQRRLERVTVLLETAAPKRAQRDRTVALAEET